MISNIIVTSGVRVAVQYVDALYGKISCMSEFGDDNVFPFFAAITAKSAESNELPTCIILFDHVAMHE